MRFLPFLTLLCCLIFSGCSTTRDGQTVDLTNKEAKRDVNSTDVDVNKGITLDAYLRRLPGVNVRGEGANAQVQIRGNSSFGGGSSPLFVVDGTILGNSYAQLLSTVDPSEIARVRVLKNASETAEYGLQGGNGVLEFKLKKK